MYKCVFLFQNGQPKPGLQSGFVFINDFNDLRNRQIKAHFSYVLVFSPFPVGSCGKNDRAAAIAYNSAAAVVSSASTPSSKGCVISACAAFLQL